MAQNIQLKRSALPGKVPDTGSLNLGEIAINTYDGKVFLKKSGSIESIQELVTTNTTNTGSITLTQTGSFGELVVTQDANIQRDLYVTNDIIGNGDIDVLGNITGSNLLIKGTLTAQSYIVSSSVVNMTTQFASGSTIFGNTSDDTHEFTGSVNITGSGYINSNRIITDADTGSFATSGGYPESGVDYNTDSTTVADFNIESPQFLIDYLYETSVGTEVGLKGFIGNTSGSTLVVPGNDFIGFVIDDIEVARVTADGFEGVSLPSGLITGSSQLTSSYDTRYVLSGSITQTTWDNIASKPSGIISSSIQVLGGTNIISSSSQLNNTTIENLTIQNLTTITETASVIYSSGSNRFGDFGNDIHEFTGSVSISGSITTIGILSASVIVGEINSTNGVVSGSSQLTASLDIRYALSGSVGGGNNTIIDSRTIFLSQSVATNPWTFTHNIGSEYPMITVYNSNNEIIQPEYIKSINLNETEIGFGTNVSGIAVASLGSLTEVTGRTIKHNFTNSETWSFVHNMGDKYVVIQTFDDNDEMILPSSITLATISSSIITFSEPITGYALATIGGDLPAISASYEGYSLKIQNGLPNWTSTQNFISSSSQLTSSYDTRYVLSGSITQTTWDNIASKPNGIVSGSSQLTSSYDERYVISGSITQTTWDNIESKPSGIISGSTQLTSSFDIRYALSSSGVSRTIEVYTATSNQSTFNTTASASVGNVDIHINGFKLPPSDFTVVNTNTITLTTGSVEGELVEIGIYNTFFERYFGFDDIESLNQFTASNGNISLNLYTGSNDTLNSLQNIRIDQIALHTSSLNSYTSSNETRWTSFFAYSSSTDNRLNNLESKSASVDISVTNINSFTSSTDVRLNTIEGKYATTGSNTFIGTQIFTGSVYITSDLIVQGSSSLQNITASAVSIGTNIVQLNTATPAVRFAGLQVIDSGSTAMSASLFWDSVNNHWIYQRESGAVYGGGMLISGPRNLGTLGDEIGITNNRVVMGNGGDHISSSGMWTDGNNLSIPLNLEVTGSLTSPQITSLTSKTGSYATTGSNQFNGNQIITGSLVIGAASALYPVSVYTSSANTNNVIAEFYNGDYTAGTKNFIRVRNNVSIGSSMSSYFGQGQDNNTYIVSNDFSRGGDIVINGNTGDTTFVGNVIPKTNNSKDLGSATYGWRNIYTNDLHLSNEGKPEGNDIDGTTGNWTIQEGAENLYIINNKTGKKFKFSLEEIQ
jgi:hypothetical protein